MSDYHPQLASLLRQAAGDPFQMLQLRRLAESAMWFTGFETDEDLVAALVRAGSRGRFGPQSTLDDDHVGAWGEGEIGGDAEEVGEEEDFAPQQRRGGPELDLDQNRQAAALVTAAEDGTPFCEECERARQGQAA